MIDTHKKRLYLYEDFALDASQKSLRRSGCLVSITPKAIDTLLVLIKYKGAVVEKDTLLNEVWTDTFVEEATLAQNISTLRRVLGTTPDKKFIETIPRRGYRFVREVGEFDADEKEIALSGDHCSPNDVDAREAAVSGDGAIEVSVIFQTENSPGETANFSVDCSGEDWTLQMRLIKHKTRNRPGGQRPPR